MTDTARQRVLVTGAGGFLGVNLVRRLVARGVHVLAVVRPGTRPSGLAGLDGDIELLEADVHVPGEIESAVGFSRPEFAVNLAVSRGHPGTRDARARQLEGSVLGTARLVEFLAHAGCRRLVHVGSSLEYGPCTRPLVEEDLLAPVVPRGAAKAAETLVCLTWGLTLGLPIVVLRPFSVYGPWEHASRFVPTVLRAAYSGAELPLTEPGLVHDFVYVGDVAAAIDVVLASSGEHDGKVFNIGSGVETTNEELVATIERLLGRRVSTRPGAYPTSAHDSTRWVADISRARRELAWAPTPLEAGLRATISWFAERADPTEKRL